MTSDLLLGRALGAISPQAFASTQTSQLLHAIQAAPNVKFDGSKCLQDPVTSRANKDNRDGPLKRGDAEETDGEGEGEQVRWAHRAGVNTLTIDRFEGRYLLTGAASSTVSLWDLESPFSSPSSHYHSDFHPTANTIYRPLASYTPPPSTQVRNSGSGGSVGGAGGNYGTTTLTFYPFDSGAFLRSSYNHTLTLHATSSSTLQPSATFDLRSVIYNHAISPIATHLLVACATAHPSVRLVDLRSGASAQQLTPGHGGGPVFACAWSPTDEYILASGGADGVVRLWDVRRGAPSLGVLDLEDSVGVGGEDGQGKNARHRDRGRAHAGGGACNGLVWTDDGRWLVSAGHDERVRVWDVSVGANALSHFGPVIRNSAWSTLSPLLVPSSITTGRESVMVYPIERELLMFDLFEGTLLKRLKVPGKAVAQARKNGPGFSSGGGGLAGGGGGGERNIKHRTTGLAWRGAGEVEIYSSHSDGVVRAWKPKTKAESELEKEEALALDVRDVRDDDDGDDGGRKRKRQALDDVFRELTKQKITFT